MTEPKLDPYTLELVMEVLLHDIELPPQGRFYALKALWKTFPDQMPGWAELTWRIKEAETFRDKRLAKRRAHEKRLEEHKEAIEAKL